MDAATEATGETVSDRRLPRRGDPGDEHHDPLLQEAHAALSHLRAATVDSVPSAPEPNAAMAHHWNVEAGPSWVLNEQHLDAMLEPFLARLMDVAATDDR